MVWISDIRLPARENGVQRARALVDTSGLPLTGEVRDDVRLLVSELATNAVRHGAPDADEAQDARIRVRLGVDDRTLRVEVHDNGPGFRHVPRGAGSELGSGWGVHFVHTLADRWGAGHDDAGTWVVWFEIELPNPRGDGDEMLYGQRAGDGLPLDPRTRSGRSAARPRSRSRTDLADTG